MKDYILAVGIIFTLMGGTATLTAITATGQSDPGEIIASGPARVQIASAALASVKTVLWR